MSAALPLDCSKEPDIQLQGTTVSLTIWGCKMDRICRHPMSKSPEKGGFQNDSHSNVCFCNVVASSCAEILNTQTQVALHAKKLTPPRVAKNELARQL